MSETTTELDEGYVAEITALVKRADRGESIRTAELYRALSYLIDLWPEYTAMRNLLHKYKRPA